MKTKKTTKKSKKNIKNVPRDAIPIYIQPDYEDLLAEINISRRFLEAFPPGF